MFLTWVCSLGLGFDVWCSTFHDERRKAVTVAEKRRGHGEGTKKAKGIKNKVYCLVHTY